MNDLTIIIRTVIMGTVARIMGYFKEDYRQYPSYPNGIYFISHLSPLFIGYSRYLGFK
ncbi:YIEGIA domain-containing protein [Cerasibacillus sp. JNUCC 74]